MTIPLSCESCQSILDFYSKKPVNKEESWFCNNDCHKQKQGLEMSFDWQRWIEKFIAHPGYNCTEAVISEAVSPAYKVIGIHRLTSSEDNARQLIYVDVLDTNNKRQTGAEIEYNSGTSNPLLVKIDRPSNEITYFPFPDQSSLNVWHPDGEGVIGLEPGYSYLVVFREVSKPTTEVNLGGIQVTVNQEWIASMKPDSLGNVTFYVDIKQ